MGAHTRLKNGGHKYTTGTKAELARSVQVTLPRPFGRTGGFPSRLQSEQHDQTASTKVPSARRLRCRARGRHPSDDSGRTWMKRRGGEILDIASERGGGVEEDVVMTQ